MDTFLKTIYGRMRSERGCSVDDILEDPALRSQFLSRAWEDIPSASERSPSSSCLLTKKRSANRADYVLTQ